MLVNRFDWHADEELQQTYGLGLELLDTANYEAPERDMIAKLLAVRRQAHGDGVVALDIGANIGPHTVAWARSMTGWGRVFAFEAQRWSYYALCGNLVLNNCLNAMAFNIAVGDIRGQIRVPDLDPAVCQNFGGLELWLHPRRTEHQYLGAAVDRTETGGYLMDVVPLDELDLPRVDLMKIDVEGMENAVVSGAKSTIKRCKPMLFIEWVKTPVDELAEVLRPLGYNKLYKFGMNLLGVHPEDPCSGLITLTEAEDAEI
jgi:FkbM family methyltransferase